VLDIFLAEAEYVNEKLGTLINNGLKPRPVRHLFNGSLSLSEILFFADRTYEIVEQFFVRIAIYGKFRVVDTPQYRPLAPFLKPEEFRKRALSHCAQNYCLPDRKVECAQFFLFEAAALENPQKFLVTYHL
jgi:hypothetical protein